MGRSTDYKHGMKAGVRWTITWLRSRAFAMNDQKARDILNSAAFSLGGELSETDFIKHRIEGEYERARVGHDFRTETAQKQPEPTEADMNETGANAG